MSPPRRRTRCAGVDQSRSELTEQARSQQQRLTSNLRTLTDELDSMAGQGEQQGVAHDLVRQISQQARALGDWLDGNEPGAVLDEVKRFARRKPFLAVAAGLGILSGRMTRGLKAVGRRGVAVVPATGYTAYGPRRTRRRRPECPAQPVSPARPG